ncbi:hypothetical protein PDE_05490 [Penicillium oxalicum 114-2]|uniref:Uncharacterized protein n=1 Tax=Penicillium oxalicum (strain 114-2 / CGMCC 5302) TaxID=933388 RepID=S8AW92_PENO1|nr:hypothetical protein PDE_05490 [Penicillium oxalicum 114-2]
MSPSASAPILTFYGYQTPPTFQRRGSVVVLSGSVSLVETIVPTSGPRAPSLSSLILPLSRQEDSPCLKAIARSGFCKGAEKLVPSIAARSHQPPILPSFQHDNLLCSMPIAPRRQNGGRRSFGRKPSMIFGIVFTRKKQTDRVGKRTAERSEPRAPFDPSFSSWYEMIDLLLH